MRLKSNIFLLMTLTSLCGSISAHSAGNDSPANPDYKTNNQIIKSILEKEKNPKDINNITDILNYIDNVYSGLYYKVSKGEKIIIFFDPAHGRLESGKWQGEVTGRLSATGLPEEYYSIQFARRLYKKLSLNKYIKIVSPADYMDVLTGRSSEYKRVLYKDAFKMAYTERSFIMISEHLNNISSMQKTDGTTNLVGLHITCDDAGNRYLAYIPTAFEGYLTLYNKYDISGFSKEIANRIKENISAKGVKLNGWEYGSVADDRFSYFIDFPVSLIFEQGFISNPGEEEKLRDPEYQQRIVDTQYAAIIESIKDIFGLDISGFWLGKQGENTGYIDLIKLSRIAIYYLKNNAPDKTVAIIDDIENNYDDSRYNIKPYMNLRERVIKAERSFKRCKYLQGENRVSEAKRNLYDSVNTVCNEPIYSALTEKYAAYGRRNFGIKNMACAKQEKPSKVSVPYAAAKSPLSKPIILSIEKDEPLEVAVEKALSPSDETLTVLVNSFREANVREKVKIEQYSEKAKKNILISKWENKKVNFKEGIYIITLDKKFNISKSQRVPCVLLNPEKYQNQQFLKNSYFANTIKEKSI